MADGLIRLGDRSFLRPTHRCFTHRSHFGADGVRYLLRYAGPDLHHDPLDDPNADFHALPFTHPYADGNAANNADVDTAEHGYVSYYRNVDLYLRSADGHL